jgi:hypothetical protein
MVAPHFRIGGSDMYPAPVEVFMRRARHSVLPDHLIEPNKKSSLPETRRTAALD